MVIAMDSPFFLAQVAVNEVVIHGEAFRGQLLIHRDLKRKVLAADVIPDNDILSLRIIQRDSPSVVLSIVVKGVVGVENISVGAAGGEGEKRGA